MDLGTYSRILEHSLSCEGTCSGHVSPNNTIDACISVECSSFNAQNSFIRALTQASVVYYFAAIVLHYVVPNLLQVSSVQVAKRKPGQVMQEALNSIGPLIVKAAIWTIVEYLWYTRKLNNLLFDGPLSYVYTIFTVAAMDLLHDAWFYWTHRILHTKFLFRWVHRMHHESRVPTAFTGYSFHIVEAIIVFANEILICFLFPINIRVHRVYHIYTTIIHNGGHAGYEIAPCIPSVLYVVGLLWRALTCVIQPRSKTAKMQWIDSKMNTVAHHDWHHRFPNVHFSLYMTHWDKLMGTEHKEYQGYVEELMRNSASISAKQA